MGDTTADLPKAGDHPDPNVPDAPGAPPSQPASSDDHPLIKGDVTHKQALAPAGAEPGKKHHKCPEGSKSTTWHFDGAGTVTSSTITITEYVGQKCQKVVRSYDFDNTGKLKKGSIKIDDKVGDKDITVTWPIGADGTVDKNNITTTVTSTDSQGDTHQETFKGDLRN